MGGIIVLARYVFRLSENMKFWHKIQVIIYPFTLLFIQNSVSLTLWIHLFYSHIESIPTSVCAEKLEPSAILHNVLKPPLTSPKISRGIRVIGNVSACCRVGVGFKSWLHRVILETYKILPFAGMSVGAYLDPQSCIKLLGQVKNPNRN